MGEKYARTWSIERLAAPLVLLFLAFCLAGPRTASAAGVPQSRSAARAYLEGLGRVARELVVGNGLVVTANADMGRGDVRHALSNLGAAVLEERKATSDLDALRVPPAARRVQNLLDRAMRIFISGAGLMRKAAARHDRQGFGTALAHYHAGDMLLKQATGLLINFAR